MQPRTVPAQLKQAGPGPVLYRHRKHNPAPTFIPLPERRPAIYMSIQNEHNAVSCNVNRSFTGYPFSAAIPAPRPPQTDQPEEESWE